MVKKKRPTPVKVERPDSAKTVFTKITSSELTKIAQPKIQPRHDPNDRPVSASSNYAPKDSPLLSEKGEKLKISERKLVTPPLNERPKSAGPSQAKDSESQKEKTPPKTITSSRETDISLKKKNKKKKRGSIIKAKDEGKTKIENKPEIQQRGKQIEEDETLLRDYGSETSEEKALEAKQRLSDSFVNEDALNILQKSPPTTTNNGQTPKKKTKTKKTRARRKSKIGAQKLFSEEPREVNQKAPRRQSTSYVMRQLDEEKANFHESNTTLEEYQSQTAQQIKNIIDIIQRTNPEDEDMLRIYRQVNDMQVQMKETNADEVQEKKELNEKYIDKRRELGSIMNKSNHQLKLLKNQYEKKLDTWKTRYEKLSNQFDELSHQMKFQFQDQETLRKERDLLLCHHKEDFNKRALLQGVSLTDSKLLQDFFRTTIENVTMGIRDALNCEYALMWVYNHSNVELETVSIYPVEENENNNEPSSNILSIPSSKSIVGQCFEKSRAINVLHCFKEDQLNDYVDDKMGCITQTCLLYPLLHPKTQTAIGVLQCVNKKTSTFRSKSSKNTTSSYYFTVSEQEMLRQYALVVSRLLEKTKDFFDYGRGSRTFNMNAIPIQMGKVPESILVRQAHSMDNKIEFLKHHGGLLPQHVKAYIRTLYKQKEDLTYRADSQVKTITKLQESLEDLKKELASLKFNQYIFVEDANNMPSREALSKQIEEMEKHIEEKREHLNLDVDLVKTTDSSTPRTKKRPKSALHALHVDTQEQLAHVESEARREQLNQLEKELMALDHTENLLNESMGPDSLATLASPIKSLPSSTSKRRKSKVSSKKKAASKKKASLPPTIQKREKSMYKDVYIEMFIEMQVPLMLLSKYYQVVHINREFTNVFQYSQNDLIGQLFSYITKRIKHAHLGEFFTSSEQQEVEVYMDMHRQEHLVNIKKYDIKITELGYADSKFRICNTSVPLEGPLFLAVFYPSHDVQSLLAAKLQQTSSRT